MNRDPTLLCSNPHFQMSHVFQQNKPDKFYPAPKQFPQNHLQSHPDSFQNLAPSHHHPHREQPQRSCSFPLNFQTPTFPTHDNARNSALANPVEPLTSSLFMNKKQPSAGEYYFNPAPKGPQTFQEPQKTPILRFNSVQEMSYQEPSSQYSFPQFPAQSQTNFRRSVQGFEQAEEKKGVGSAGKVPSGEKKEKAKGMIEKIEKFEINPISLLNEINGKLKKKADYQLKEYSVGRNRVFECLCFLDGQLVGSQKGNSKQHAKAEAAKDGIFTILTQEKYVAESAVIILSIQKASEKTTRPEKHLTHSSFLSDSTLPQTPTSNITKRSARESQDIVSESEDSHRSVPSIFGELNALAKSLDFEPIWSFPHETTDGDFEVELRFGDLIVKEKRKKKQEAKKEAALKMYEKIKELDELERSLNKSFHKEHISQGKIKDGARKLFKKSLKPKLLEKLKDLQEEKQIVLQNQQQDLDNYLDIVIHRCEVGVGLNESLQEFLKKMTDYTSIITSNPKQVMFDARQHIADYIKECYLVPVGSFALNCMRNDHLVMDTILNYQEIKAISSTELLELYRYSLETCYFLDQQAGTQIIDMKFSFNIKGDFIEIVETKKSKGAFRIHIYLSAFTRTSSRSIAMNPSFHQISHIQQIYDMCSHCPDELEEMRGLLSIIRSWRRRAKLDLVPVEILDLALIDVYLNNKSSKASILTKFFILLSSENLLLVLLEKLKNQDLSFEGRGMLSSSAKKTLQYLNQQRFVEASLL